MLHKALIPLIATQVGVVRKRVLHRATQYCAWLDEPIRLGDNATIERAWRLLRRCAVVLHSICHRGDLLGGKPLPQRAILQHYAPRLRMVDIAPHSKPRIVVGGNDIGHIHPRTQLLGKCHTALDDHLGMVTTMCRIETIIARQYLALYILYNLSPNHATLPYYNLNKHLALEVLTRKVAHLLGRYCSDSRHAMLRGAVVHAAHDILYGDIRNAERTIEDA